MLPEISSPPEVEALIARSRLLGGDRRLTNFAGGNTSCKTDSTDPVTGKRLRLLWVKGSGGDLGTLTPEGLAVLDLDRLLALENVYRGPEYEDEIVALFDHCRFEPAGAAPSIDTALHALVPPAHVDHLHPDSVIALAAAQDGEALVKECFGADVAWLGWRRPGFELALQMRALYRDNPGLRGIILSGHGLFTWGETSDECQATTLEIIGRAETFLSEKGKPDPFGPVVAGRRALRAAARRSRAAELAPVVRGLASSDHRVVGHFTDDDAVLDFLAGERSSDLALLGTSCPDHFLRTKVRPLLLDLPAEAVYEHQVPRLKELHSQYRDAYSEYYRRHAGAGSPPMRGADPAIFLVPGIGMWSFGTDAHEARVAGEFYVNAINVMHGAESVSRYEPISDAEKFAIEYWDLEEAKLRRRPPAGPLAGRVAFVTGGASGIGRAIATRFAGEGAAVVVADLNEEGATEVARGLGGADHAIAVQVDVGDESAVANAFRLASLAFGGVDLVINGAGISISAPLVETTVEAWDLQHRVMSRGSFLVSQAASTIMIKQGMGGDIIYIVSKNAVVAGPNNIAYGAAKADQAHQVRLLASELGAFGIRVNGINPDGVVRGSGIFANGWGADRAALYGVKEEELGKYYADRTLLKKEVLPEHVAAAAFALVGGELSLTTGTIIPVDGGVPSAFLR